MNRNNENNKNNNDDRKRKIAIIILICVALLAVISTSLILLLPSMRGEENHLGDDSTRIAEVTTEGKTTEQKSKTTKAVKATTEAKATTEKATAKGKSGDKIAKSGKTTTKPDATTQEQKSTREQATTREQTTTQEQTTTREQSTTREQTTTREQSTTREQATTEAPTREQTTECSHNWVAQYDTKTEKVMIEDSWDEDIYEDRAYCSYCGKDVTGDTDHIGECGEEYYDEDLGMTIHEGASSIIRPTKIKTVHHPALGNLISALTLGCSLFLLLSLSSFNLMRPTIVLPNNCICNGFIPVV
jgi:hypothetical protein